MNPSKMKMWVAFFFCLCVSWLGLQVRLGVAEHEQLEFDKLKYGCGIGQ